MALEHLEDLVDSVPDSGSCSLVQQHFEGLEMVLDLDQMR